MEILAADYSSSSAASSPRSDAEAHKPALQITPNVLDNPDPGSRENGSSSPSPNSEPDGDDDSADGFEVISVKRTATGAKKRDSDSPEGAQKTALEAWVADALALRNSTGIELNEAVRKNRNFRNPSILQKMIAYCGIDEYASNIDTPQITPEEFYDAIAERQRAMAEDS